MNILLGVLMAGFFMFLGIPGLQQNWQNFIDLPSLSLVLGGTLATSLISSSFEDMVQVVMVFTGIWFVKRKPVSNIKAVDKLVEISKHSYQDGIASVIEMGKDFGDGFLDRTLSLVGTGLDEDFIRKTLEVDIVESQHKLQNMIGVVRNIGVFATMFGMLGTTAGVILVLQNVTDINSVIDGLAFALITTIYGLLVMCVLVSPCSNQIQKLADAEKLSKRIMMEGALSVLRGDIPLKVEKFLLSFLNDAEREKFSKK